jgi:hypothetical protein
MLTQTTDTLKSWLEITDKEIEDLRANGGGDNADRIAAQLDHALKVRDIVAGELDGRLQAA